MEQQFSFVESKIKSWQFLAFAFTGAGITFTLAMLLAQKSISLQHYIVIECIFILVYLPTFIKYIRKQSRKVIVNIANNTVTIQAETFTGEVKRIQKIDISKIDINEMHRSELSRPIYYGMFIQTANQRIQLTTKERSTIDAVSLIFAEFKYPIHVTLSQTV